MFAGELDRLIYAKEARDIFAVDLAEQVGQALPVLTSDDMSHGLKDVVRDRLQKIYSLYKAQADRYEHLLDMYERKTWK